MAECFAYNEKVNSSNLLLLINKIIITDTILFRF